MNLPTLLPMRFSQAAPECAQVPGQALPGRMGSLHFGTPLNCRRLLVSQPKAPPEPTQLIVPPEVYDWVPDFLTSYQRRGLLWATRRRAAHFWWSCGSGKTLASAYWALMYPGPVVVVTRATVRNQFAREVQRIAQVKTLALFGQQPRLELLLDEQPRVVVLGWEILPHWVDTLVAWVAKQRAASKHPLFASAIYDELHKGKQWKRQERYIDERDNVAWRDLTNQSAAAARLSDAMDRRLGLTATPIPNTLADLWSQLDIIERWCWGTNWDFVHRYCDAKPAPLGRGIDTTGRSNVAELTARLREVSNIVKSAEAYADLPPKRRQVTFLGASDQNTPSSFNADMKRAARSGKQALFEMRLAEAAARKRDWVTAEAVEALANGQKVVVFTGRKVDVDRLADSILKGVRKLKLTIPAVFAAHGETDPAEREAMAASYGRETGPALLVGTGQAFGESIDGLQTTDLAILAMLPWTPKEIEQQEGRFTRRGQDRPVRIVYPIAEGTVDEHVADLLLVKLDAVDETVAQLGVQSEAGATSTALAGLGDEDAIVSNLLSKI